MIKFSIEEAYKTVKAHLEAGGKRSQLKGTRGSQCAYRGVDGAKCFIGLMIPDDKYHDDFEKGMSAISMVRHKIIKGSPVFGEALGELQELHDNPNCWSPDGTYNAYSLIDSWFEKNKEVV